MVFRRLQRRVRSSDINYNEAEELLEGTEEGSYNITADPTVQTVSSEPREEKLTAL